MIDPNDKLAPLAKVTKWLPPPLRDTHIGTVTRWALRGVGSPRVRLATVKIGGRRFVTRAALNLFIKQLSGDPAPTPAAASAARTRQVRRAEDELDRAGI
jgi:hypothetical protein